ncbi:GNAT family N-acetyltransferase [Coprobacter sp.]
MKIHLPERPCISDYDDLTDLWEKSVRATHSFLREEDIIFFKSLIRNEYLFLVDLFGYKDKQGQWIAFMGISGNKLEMLFLLPSARGKGFGKCLIEYAVKTLGIDAVDVNEQNEQAVGFYLHLGFRIIGRDAVDNTGKPYPILHLQL